MLLGPLSTIVAVVLVVVGDDGLIGSEVVQPSSFGRFKGILFAPTLNAVQGRGVGLAAATSSKEILVISWSLDTPLEAK